MRPASITMFDRLFLGAIVLGILNTVVSYDETMAQLKADPAVVEMGMATPGFLFGTAAFGFAISLLLWFLISRKAATVAKWILTVFTVIGTLMIPFSLGELGLIAMILTLLVTAMQIAAIWMLFRPDAKLWFEHGPKGMDPSTFE
jgi:hypothetical protein